MDKILVFDFGGQTTQLIGRRIRDICVYSEIVPGDIKITDGLLKDVKGIILSGSPYSVYDSDSPKPDPEIYLLLAKVLNLKPENCLVIEDSTVGIRAALNANMKCIAVTNELTRSAVHSSRLLDSTLIVDDLNKLQSTVENFIQQN